MNKMKLGFWTHLANKDDTMCRTPTYSLSPTMDTLVNKTNVVSADRPNIDTNINILRTPGIIAK